MQTTYLLIDAVRKALEEEFSDKQYRVSPDGGYCEGEEPVYRAPKVVIGHMPPKRSDTRSPEGEDQPFILVRPLTGEVTGENPRAHRVRLGIICSIYEPESSASDAGHLTILTMMDAVIRMLSERFEWADGHWRHELPIEWTHGMHAQNARSEFEAGMQGHPYYSAIVITRFVAAATVTKPSIATAGMM